MSHPFDFDALEKNQKMGKMEGAREREHQNKKKTIAGVISGDQDWLTNRRSHYYMQFLDVQVLFPPP